jgi:hypothetical protein
MASNPAKKRGSGSIESFMLSTTAYVRLKRHLAGREAATNENDLVHFASVDTPTGAGGWDHAWEHASRGVSQRGIFDRHGESPASVRGSRTFRTLFSGHRSQSGKLTIDSPRVPGCGHDDMSPLQSCGNMKSRRRYDAAFSVLLLMLREHFALILALGPNWRVYPRILIRASRQSRQCPGRQQKSPNDRRVR